MLFTALVSWLIVIAGATLQLSFSKAPRTATRVLQVFLVWLLAVSGFGALLAGALHISMGPAIARQIGWPPGSPFQFEVGVANLAVGILGVMCIWARGRFWLATIVAMCVWYLGDAVGHVREIVVAGNYAPGNVGVPLYQDVLLPAVLIALYVAYRVSLRRHPERATELIEERRVRVTGGRAYPAT